MPTNLSNKQAVWELWQRLSGSNSSNIGDVVQPYYRQDTVWHGPQPINELSGLDALVAEFWTPLLNSFPDAQRNTIILMGGAFRNQTWVGGTGYFVGTFAHDWLGIPATHGKIHIRFSEFCRMDGDKIAETYLILDVLDVMRQTGFTLLPSNGGAEGLVPPPRANDGILLSDQDSDATAASLKLVSDMLFGGLNSFDGEDLSGMGMLRYWYPDMQWYGPSGIGTSHNHREFEDFHQRPFLTAFPDRKATDQDVFIADGIYVAASGFPGVIGTHLGEYLGCPPTSNVINMRVMDFWRRDGNLLLENWVVIDIIDIFHQFGINLFERMRAQIVQ